MHLLIAGGSDAGISAALRAHELDPAVEITVVLGDDYPNFSICGLPYYLSGETLPWFAAVTHMKPLLPQDPRQVPAIA